MKRNSFGSGNTGKLFKISDNLYGCVTNHEVAKDDYANRDEPVPGLQDYL